MTESSAPDEKRKAQDERAKSAIRQRKWSIISRWLGGAFALVSAVAAALAALSSWRAAETASSSALQQADQNELAMGITAIGSGQPAEQVAGLILLRRNATAQVKMPLPVPQGTQKAFDTYATSLQVLASFIQVHSPPAGLRTGSYGLGYGRPLYGQLPFDIFYAGGQLRRLLALRDEVSKLRQAGYPSIDLAHAELFGQPWREIDFSWLAAVYAPGIDLRAANLAGSRWGSHATLSSAYLQHADLRGADLRGTKLGGADLRGAELAGADLRGAELAGADLRGANLTAADLRGASVAGANFTGAALRQAELTGLRGHAVGLPGGAPAAS